MSFGKDIGVPFTLASLPRPVAASGRTQAAGVCSITGTKKRKRTEIAVGSDGEGILIYSLQNPQLVTSYALPPSTSFTAAPYSIYRKGSATTPSRRFTYAFVTQSANGEKPHLVCFAEETLKDNTDTVKSTYIPSNSARVIAIDSLPVSAEGSTKDGSHDVLVIFDNGDIICLSSDLSTVRWVINFTHLLGEKESSEFEVEHVSLSSAKAVLRGLLRNRQDVATLLDPSLEGKSDHLDLTQILCLVVRHDAGTRTLNLFQLQPRAPNLNTSQHRPLKSLLAWTLPKSKLPLVDTRRQQCSLHAASGALHLLVDGAIISYDFSGTVPRISSESVIPGLSIDSFIRLSTDLLFTTSQDVCHVLDVKYNSIQGVRCLENTVNNSFTSPSTSKKRKQSESQSSSKSLTSPILITYYADIKLALGILHNDLIGIQIGETVTRKRARTEKTLLVDALGKGMTGTGAQPIANVNDGKRQERKAKLEQHASEGNIAKFEKIFAEYLSIELADGRLMNGDIQVTGKKDVSDVLGNTIHKGAPTSSNLSLTIPNEPLPDDQLQERPSSIYIPDTPRQRCRSHALFALSRIFRWVRSPAQDGPRGTLRIEFFPPNVFQWVLRVGHLTKESVRKALLEYSSNSLKSMAPFSDGDIVKAIVDFDPELHVLSAVLNNEQFLPIGEVVQAIKLLMQSLDDQPKSEATGLQTNGTGPTEEQMDVDTELDAASHEIDHALSVLENGALIRSHALRPALMRLHSFPTPLVSSTLRSILTRRDLESLIQLLHFEFKNGGWPSPYDFANSEASPVEASSEEQDDHAVAIIASLLSCALDAIGAAAWLATTGGSNESTSQVIESLHRDTTEAMSGFWEARYVRGLLGEFLRYASNLPKWQKSPNKSLERQDKPFAAGLKADELPMLPLGSKPDLGPEKTKAGKGGKREERSQREIGMLISKRVPKYSFERIVL